MLVIVNEFASPFPDEMALKKIFPDLDSTPNPRRLKMNAIGLKISRLKKQIAPLNDRLQNIMKSRESVDKLAEIDDREGKHYCERLFKEERQLKAQIALLNKELAIECIRPSISHVLESIPSIVSIPPEVISIILDYEILSEKEVIGSI